MKVREALTTPTTLKGKATHTHGWCAQHTRQKQSLNHHHHRHLSLNHQGHWGTTDDFATSLLHFPLFSTAH